MKILILVNSFIFFFSVLGFLLVFLFTPLLVWIVYLIKGKKTVKHSSTHLSVSLITVAHNAEDLIVDKIKNSLLVSFPSDNYEIIIFSDGLTDRTENKVKPFIGKSVHFLSSPCHEGKISGINKAVRHSTGEIIVFSDADAILDSNAIINLVKNFADPEVGGVCGKNIIYETNKKLKYAQSVYMKFDIVLKKLESQIGSIASNTGKLYAIRRNLFQPMHQAVTDDLYVCLSIVKQNYRFIFEPEASAYIKVPARSSMHEVERRRRIVSQSLRGMFLNKEVLNPLKYGVFSVNLFVNKVIRRCLPFLLFLLFFSSLFLSFYNQFIKTVLFLQFAFYILAFSYQVLFQYIPQIRVVSRLASVAYYFCLGNFGTLLGVCDFLMGKQVGKWEPIKTSKKI